MQKPKTRILGLLATIVFIGCAGAQFASQSVHTSASALSAIDVAPSEDGALLRLIGVSESDYTTYRHDADQTLVIELFDTDLILEPGSRAIENALIDDVHLSYTSASNGFPTTRVEISLNRDYQYEVTADVDTMELHFKTLAGDASLAQNEVTKEDGEVALVSASEASELHGVDVLRGEQFTELVVLGDGAMRRFESFVLDEPARLVVDLLDMKNLIPNESLNIGSEQASQLRLGQHQDRVRMVVDMGGSEVVTHQITPSETGLRIQLGELSVVDNGVGAASLEDDASMLAEAVSEEPSGLPLLSDAFAPLANLSEEEPSEAFAAPEIPSSPNHGGSNSFATPAPFESPEEAGEGLDTPELAAPAEVAPVQPEILQVLLEPTQSGQRVKITASESVEYQLFEPVPETLIVSFPGTRFESEDSQRIAPDETGPISLVSTFAQPDLAYPEARVVIQRAAGSLPTISRDGDQLLLEFERSLAQAPVPPVKTLPAENSEAQNSAPIEVAKSDPAAPSLPGLASQNAAAPPAALGPVAPVDLLEEGGFVEEKQYAGRRLSLDFKDAALSDVLRLIADVADLNIVTSDEVDGAVTIRLVDIPWDQALDVVLMTKGLGFERVGNVLRIAPSALLQQEREARLQERRAQEKIEDLVVKMQPVNYADVKEVSEMVKPILTSRGSVLVDQRTSTLILKDIPQVIDEATALIKAVDTQTPQVLIEARVVEASIEYSRSLGTTWSIGLDPATAHDSLGHRDFNPNDLESTDSGQVTRLATSLAASDAAGTISSGVRLLKDIVDIDMALQAAENNGDAKVVSSPRIVTLDNRSAKIEQGVAFPCQVFDQETNTTSVEFKKAALRLEVVPHITSDRSVIMEINLESNSPNFSVATNNACPPIDTNEAQTETLVRDGQTLVIGGVYVLNRSDSSSGVPYLKDIPFIGAAFRNSIVSDDRRELLMFLTPRIATADGFAVAE